MSYAISGQRMGRHDRVAPPVMNVITIRIKAVSDSAHQGNHGLAAMIDFAKKITSLNVCEVIDNTMIKDRHSDDYTGLAVGSILFAILRGPFRSIASFQSLPHITVKISTCLQTVVVICEWVFFA